MNTGFNTTPEHTNQIRDCMHVIRDLKWNKGIENPTFQDFACHSPIKDIFRFAAMCCSILKNGRPEQWSDFVEPCDEEMYQDLVTGVWYYSY